MWQAHNVFGSKLLMGFQPYPLDKWISNGNTISKQTINTWTDSRPLKKTASVCLIERLHSNQILPTPVYSVINNVWSKAIDQWKQHNHHQKKKEKRWNRTITNTAIQWSTQYLKKKWKTSKTNPSQHLGGVLVFSEMAKKWHTPIN